MEEPKTIRLDLNPNELNTVLGVLGEAPAKVSMALISKIQREIQIQTSPRGPALVPPVVNNELQAKETYEDKDPENN